MSVLALLVGFFSGVCEDNVIILNQYFFLVVVVCSLLFLIQFLYRGGQNKNNRSTNRHSALIISPNGLYSTAH